MNVILISANQLLSPYPVYPLGLDFVAGSIAKKHNVKIIDMNCIDDTFHLQKEITAFKPDIVGISLRNIDNTDINDPKFFIKQYKNLIIQIKNIYPNTPIILGGSGFSLFSNELLNILDADFGLIGDGEKFNLALDALEKKKDVTKINGIVTKNKKSIAMPSLWDKEIKCRFNKNNFHVSFYLKTGGMLNLQTKRGCIFKCIYCTYPNLEGKKIRFINPDDVAITAKKLQDAGAKYIYMTDSAFNADYDHSLKVAFALKKYNIKLPWGAFFLPTKAPKDYYKKLADAGLTHVEFGTESLSEKMLKSYQKPFTTKDVFCAHKLACNANLKVAHYFLFGGPNENHKSIEEALENIDKLKKTVLFFFCGIRIYPNTKLYDIAVSNGQITSTQNILEPIFYKPESIKKDEILELVNKKANKRQNWIIGSGDDKTNFLVSELYKRGHTGPLWEHLI